MLCLCLASTSAHASLGMFEHGNGIASMGMGGVSYSFAEETTTLAANPAHALALGNRYDVGIDVFAAEAGASYEGNALGPDETFKSKGREWYSIPQGGYSRQLTDRIGFGITMLSAGMGPDYDRSPYRRFGGAPRTNLNLASSSVVTALAYKMNPVHTIGIGLNVGYQSLSVEGVEFIANPETSVAPNHVTNQGKDGAFSLGFSVGWHAQYTPWLAVGAGYRSKNLTQRHEDYRGLVAEGGKLELPAIYGGGFTLTPIDKWTFSFEAQRYAYRKQRAFRNGLGRLAVDRYGSDNGPGFGFKDQNAYKFGVRWQATPNLALRAGYVYATQIVNEADTLFGFFGCVTVTDQYSIGSTWQVRDWELTTYAFNGLKDEVKGRNSIPEAFGGGEANVSDRVVGFGLSLGRRFGGK